MSSITNRELNDSNEEKIEKSLRPQNFEEVIGRELEKKSLKIMIEAAQKEVMH